MNLKAEIILSGPREVTPFELNFMECQVVLDQQKSSVRRPNKTVFALWMA